MTINIVEALADSLGTTTRDVRERGSLGSITFEQLTEAFNSAISKDKESLLKPAVSDIGTDRPGSTVTIEGGRPGEVPQYKYISDNDSIPGMVPMHLEWS